MKEKRSNNLFRSIIVSMMIFCVALYFLWDANRPEILLLLVFVTAQLLAIFISVFLIVLRLQNTSQYKYSFSYLFLGTFQFFLLITDMVLLFVPDSLTRGSLIIFIFVNFFISVGIYNDIYRIGKSFKSQ